MSEDTSIRDQREARQAFILDYMNKARQKCRDKNVHIDNTVLASEAEAAWQKQSEPKKTSGKKKVKTSSKVSAE